MKFLLLATLAFAATDFTGTYDCPAYNSSDNQWNAHQMVIEQKTISGLPILVTEIKGDLSNKMGPYKHDIAIVDGMWRYFPFYRANKLYPVKTKSWIEGNKILWTAEYPAYTENGKKKKAGTGKGSYWLDSNGDMISEASHYTGQYVCKKVAKK